MNISNVVERIVQARQCSKELTAAGDIAALKDKMELIKQHMKITIKNLESTVNDIGETFSIRLMKNKTKELIGYMKEYQVVESSLAKTIGIYADAIQAYGDANELFNGRNLNWRGRFTTAGKLAEIMKMAVPKGYNNFNARKVGAAAMKFSGYKYAFAREGSPALYINGVKTKDELSNVLVAFERAGADELGVEIRGKWIDLTKSDAFDKLPEELRGTVVRVWWS